MHSLSLYRYFPISYTHTHTERLFLSLSLSHTHTHMHVHTLTHFRRGADNTQVVPQPANTGTCDGNGPLDKQTAVVHATPRQQQYIPHLDSSGTSTPRQQWYTPHLDSSGTHHTCLCRPAKETPPFLRSQWLKAVIPKHQSSLARTNISSEHQSEEDPTVCCLGYKQGQIPPKTFPYQIQASKP